ncbi:MAG: fimbrial biosis outer rane usher protein [Nevskia sp.]|nr:fimbrial biosis outer rane usher protein [Nevskia sp.]
MCPRLLSSMPGQPQLQPSQVEPCAAADWQKLRALICAAGGAWSLLAPTLAADDTGLTSRPAATALTNAIEVPDGTLLFLEVRINGQPTQSIVSFREYGGRLFIGRDDLQQLGIKSEQLQPAATAADPSRAPSATAGLVGLDQLSELSYRYDPATQSIDLILSDRLRTPNVLSNRAKTASAWASSTGAVLNYDAYLQSDTDTFSNASLTVANEQRLFSALGILDNTGIARASRGQPPYLRLDSAWHYDNPQDLTTAQAGDVISSSLNWSRAVRLGGFQYRRNFALRPDLITFPVPQLSGSAAVPSAVDLYINNVRQFSDQVPSGPFVINNPLALTGAGQARLVIRDALGREVSTTLPIYVDNRMMATGLNAYSIEAGVLRRGYGLHSFDYGQTPAFSASYRHGLSDAITLEAHNEASESLFNTGAGGLLRLGQWGVINSAVSGSAGSNSGLQINLGYQLILPALSFSAQTTRNFHRYSDLAAIGATAPPHAFDQINLAVPLFQTQSFGLNYVHTSNTPNFATFDATTTPIAGTPLSTQVNTASRILSMSYSAQLIKRCSLFGNAYRDLNQGGVYGVYVGVSIDLGHRLVGFVNGGRSQGQNNYGASLTKTSDYDGGWAWGLQDSESGSLYSRLAHSTYLGRYGEVGASVQQITGQTNLSLQANGGLVFMDGVLEPSRHVYDSFALVSTNGVAGVPVLNENRMIGSTSANGHLLIPDLNSYQRNHISIDTMGLPVDVSIPIDSIEVVPRGQSGALARFDIQRYSAATIILVDAGGVLLPSGTLVKHRESGTNFVVGYDGQVFVEGLQEHNHLDIGDSKLSCGTSFDYQTGSQRQISLPTIGPLVCKPNRGHPA